MNKAVRYFVSVIVISIMAFSSMAMAPAARSDASLHLKSGSFVPAQSQLAQGSQKYFIVQFAGPIQQEWKDALAAEGAEVLDYIPDYAFKVRMNPSIARRAEGMSFVSAVVAYQPEFKFGTDLKRDGELNVYRVRIERGSDFGQVRALVAQTGAEVLAFEEDLMLVAANGSFVDAIAAVDDVASISNYALNRTLVTTSNRPAGNDAAQDIIGANAAHALGYDGSTQIAAVSDTGLGNGTAAEAHVDIPASRVVAIYNWPGVTDTCFQTITNDGAIDVDSGHGTHTAGSVLSDGGAGGIGEGIAPAARLVFQATENWATISGLCQAFGWPPNGYFLTGLPADLRTMYQQAYDAGARIHSNSWGAALAGDYTLDSANTDSFVWSHRDMAITFSAGNEGIDANNNGVVDNDSIGSPATAKNVITVGASENVRADNWACDTSLTYTSHDAYQPGQTCSSMGGQNLLGTWGQRYGTDFDQPPLANDLTAGNSNQMASWSSRGPVDDGRIKPDVVAPGTWILSAYSSLYQEGYGDPVNPQNGIHQWDGWGMPYNADYKYMGGTSMSNPIAAGGVTVIRDYYQEAHALNASAALVKATLINSAVDMPDENNDGVNDNDFPIPNVHEGWGRINLAAATDGSIEFVEEAAGLGTGGTATFTVIPSGGPLKVTLVWSDYPSTESASANLVNNLDLTVTNGSSTYRGNVFSGGWSTTGGTADNRNNVENVYVQSPSGTYTVTVNAFNVPNGPQKFALVVDGGTFGTPPSTGTLQGTVTNAATGATISGATVTIVGGASTTTNGSGFYQFTNVAAGTYSVTASATGYNSSTANGVAVTAGNTTVQNFALTATGPTTGTLQGNVTNAATGANISGATVTIAGGASTTTNKSGFYQFTNVAAGTYSVTASATGYNPSTANNVTVTGGSTTVQNFVLTAAGPSTGTLQGTVTNAATGATISGATVSIAGGASTTTNGSGFYQFTNVAPNTYSVTASATGYNSSTINGVVVTGGNTTVQNFALTATPPAAAAHVGDLDGSRQTINNKNWRATVTVTVHDANHAPVANATVSGTWSSGGSGAGSCTTNASGVCSITSSNISTRNATVTFTVSNITASGYTYQSSSNHDPDGDSTGTAITIARP